MCRATFNKSTTTTTTTERQGGMSQSSEAVNQQWKAEQRAEAKEHANRPVRLRKVVGRFTPGGMDTTRQGGVIYHANRRRELLEEYRCYGSNGIDVDGMVKAPLQRKVSCRSCTLSRNFSTIGSGMRHGVREQTVEDLWTC